MDPNVFTKQPWEKRKLEIDVSDALADGDSVASVVAVRVYEGTLDRSASMVFGTPGLTGNKVYATVQGGRNSTTYWVRVQVHTTNGDLIEDDLKMMIREKGSYVNIS